MGRGVGPLRAATWVLTPFHFLKFRMSPFFQQVCRISGGVSGQGRGGEEQTGPPRAANGSWDFFFRI